MQTFSARAQFDHTSLVLIMPLPECARQNRVCVLSPSEATFEKVRLLVAEAAEMARVNGGAPCPVFCHRGRLLPVRCPGKQAARL